MRSLGLDLLAVDEDFGGETGRAEAKGSAMGNRQFDEESKRAVMGGELDVQAKPGVAAGGC